ncbi:MAG: TfuA-like protein [Hyphomicrobiaceae bacterium]|nr:TfuA-like protein [Hyphomicrobiaceae bacterium]MCC0022653.1 antibiotic resistance protein [Hyphomicrobiaceae bacterium]
MTRIVFAGPSLYGADLSEFTDIRFAPPVTFGDVFRATEGGAKIIGIIDGHFEQTASVWHKEILAALSRGVQVFGGGSMGALRAAECARFGMVPVGQVAQAYCDGELTSDGDVAVINGPAEAGFVPLSEALVDALATFVRLRDLVLISGREQERLAFSARRLFFKDRTLRKIIATAQLGSRAPVVQRAYKAHRRSIKGEDALAVVRAVQGAESVPVSDQEPASWFNNSTIWHNVSRQLSAVSRPSTGSA